jgi:hypothetical protein
MLWYELKYSPALTLLATDADEACLERARMGVIEPRMNTDSRKMLTHSGLSCRRWQGIAAPQNGVHVPDAKTTRAAGGQRL